MPTYDLTRRLFLGSLGATLALPELRARAQGAAPAAAAANVEADVVYGKGGDTATLDFRRILGRRLTITGSTLRPRTAAEKGEIAVALQREVWPLLERGSVRPVVYRTFPLEQAAAAHALMESSEHVGKIVLTTEAV